MSFKDIVKARVGGKVQRTHTVPHLGEYSNAEHSWGVAMLMLQLYPEDKDLIPHCLVHDVPEAWTGDIPSPAKRLLNIRNLEPVEENILWECGLPTQKFLSQEQRDKIKFCDSLELYLWSCEQNFLGNSLANHVKNKISQYIEEQFSYNPFWIEIKKNGYEYIDMIKAMNNEY